ncbi:MAG: AAA family ATPase, partial [Planctomycetes bacterium]|nr:AAA family ATPase [Planctomycetota bacterium]
HRMTFEVDLELGQGTVDRLNEELEAREIREHVTRAYTRVQRHRMRYRLVIAHQQDARTLRVEDEQLMALNADGTPHSTIVPYIRREDGKEREYLSVKLERQSHPRTFPLPRDRTLLKEINDLVNHPHLVACARELASIGVYYIEPTRMRTEVSDIEARDPGPNGEHLASFYHWLRRVKPTRFRNLEVNLRRLIPGFEGVEVQDSSEGFLELWVREEGRGVFPASLLSEGTLRLLCLLGILQTPDPPSAVAYEEPENGVHPGRLSEMLEMLDGAARNGLQFVLTTHSATVLDLLPDAHRVRCRRVADRSVFEAQANMPLLAGAEAREELSARSGGFGARVVRGDLA